jgi:hypothetical protein
MSAPGWPTLPDGRYAVLRTHRADGASYDGFRWPTEVGGVAVAPDWDPDPSIECGHGLHGLLWGLRRRLAPDAVTHVGDRGGRPWRHRHPYRHGSPAEGPVSVRRGDPYR